MTAPVVWSELLARLLDREDLDPEQAADAVTAILAGEATSAQVAGFLVALRAKGETPSELAAMLSAVRRAGVRVPLPEEVRQRALDVVGTGGDGTSSVNISTMAALVVAGAGVPVCKHGNRAASSLCGAADVLEVLGVAIELTAQGVANCVMQAGIGFCFAPRFHPAFRFAGPTRRELGVPTAFNLLGPLANPAGVTRLLVGAASPRVASLLAQALAAAGAEKAWVVHGPWGLDELSTGGLNRVWTVTGGDVTEHTVDPEGHGLVAATLDDLRGGTPVDNAAVVRRVLAGEAGPQRDVVVLNAAAALVVAGAEPGLDTAIERAQRAIDSGAATLALDRLIEVSRDSAASEPVG